MGIIQDGVDTNEVDNGQVENGQTSDVDIIEDVVVAVVGPESPLGMATTPVTLTKTTTSTTTTIATTTTTTTTKLVAEVEEVEDVVVVEEVKGEDGPVWLQDDFDFANASYKDICGSQPWLNPEFR